MNKTVYNVTRRFARDFDHNIMDTVWVSISEPGDDTSKVQNTLLESVPNLQTAFYDATPPTYDMGRFTMHPATEEDIAPLVDFLVEHQEKDVVVNCAFGVSRSGAVAQFCQNVLNYNWNPQCKNQANPNKYIYALMVRYYRKKYLYSQPATPTIP